MTFKLFSEHLLIVVAAEVLALAVGLPLGVLCYFSPKARKPILWVVDVLQTIPALALLGIIMVLAGAGKQTVIIGIALYSLLPIVQNTNLGLLQVDPGVKEAACGMGMGRMYRLIHVEFPLAFPVVFTGVRIAAVNAVGSAVFAAFVGGGGIGTAIYKAIRIQNMNMLMQGTATLMAIAIALDLSMGWVEARIKRGHSSMKKAPARRN
ncbi:MAG: ABC transporter permease [Clostridiales bacterium]|mgnify:FL=1|jgi:osmoprotectant transport system permease protein|nr:ABC transporter permease [Clostridiales bacterium]